MNFQAVSPPAPLKNYVRHFWMLENATDDISQKTFTVMCNGVPGLIFQENPKVFTGFQGEQLPQLFVFGQATKAGQLQFSGNFCNIGVSLKPAALKSIFGLDANELTHQNTAIENLVKSSLSGRLANISSTQQKVSCIIEFLEKQAARHGQPNDRLEYALNGIQQGKKLPDLRRHLHLSERSLERLFLTHVGITPVMYSRIIRFQSAITLIRQRRSRSLTDIAHTLEYFDQSHFIRDFKLFSGVTPTTYLRKAMETMPGFPEWGA